MVSGSREGGELGPVRWSLCFPRGSAGVAEASFLWLALGGPQSLPSAAAPPPLEARA